MNKLALGTVQFGLRYGISNKIGKVKASEISDIIKLAKKEKINIIDTAISYGESEKNLGKTGVNDFKIITKLPDLPKNIKDVDLWLDKNINNSLLNLNVKSIYGLLIHKSSNLLGKTGKQLIKSLNRFKSKSIIKKIGISIYDPSELKKTMHLSKFDIVQAPLNIIDRRLETTGWLSRLNKYGVEIHTRSTFLQGLLLMKYDKIPKKFNKWNNIFAQWSSEIEKNDLDAVEECLLYPLSLPEISHIVIGVDSFNQFKDIIKLNKNITKLKKKKFNRDWSFMISNDKKLINPYNWKNL
jgi:aryl-alcohol dehydrogenase-like predicted oxidoreductase